MSWSVKNLLCTIPLFYFFFEWNSSLSELSINYLKRNVCMPCFIPFLRRTLDQVLILGKPGQDANQSWFQWHAWFHSILARMQTCSGMKPELPHKASGGVPFCSDPSSFVGCWVKLFLRMDEACACLIWENKWSPKGTFDVHVCTYPDTLLTSCLLWVHGYINSS